MTLTFERDGEDNKSFSKRITASLHDHVKNLATSDAWKNALTFVSKFHQYSFGNRILIQLQRPDATYVAGFKRWIELGRAVRKGEKGIAILRPNTYTVEKEDEHGNKERRPVIKGFGVVHVFDVAQTEGDDLPLDVLTPKLLADHDDAERIDMLDDLLVIHAKSRGFEVEIGPTLPAHGWTNMEDHTIRIGEHCSNLQRLKTLAHELGHVIAKHSKDDGFDYHACRGQAECEAESVAYIVMTALGFDTGEYTFAYVAHWNQENPDVVLKYAERINDAATTLLDALGSLTKEKVSA